MHTPRVTEAMTKVWDELQVGPSESVGQFRERWDELLDDLTKAKPEAISKNDTEKRLKYIQAWERAGRFTGDLKEFRRKKTPITEVEEWFTEVENLPAIQLLTRHGMTHKGICELAPEADIFNLENPDCIKALCIHFSKFGNCKYGDKCRFKHAPQFAGKRVNATNTGGGYKGKDGGKQKQNKKKKKKPKSQTECKFHKKGNCKKGDKCDYKHSKHGEINAVEAVEPKQPEVDIYDGEGECNMFEIIEGEEYEGETSHGLETKENSDTESDQEILEGKTNVDFSEAFSSDDEPFQWTDTDGETDNESVEADESVAIVEDITDEQVIAEVESLNGNFDRSFFYEDEASEESSEERVEREIEERRE